jgi:hypothetical protein
VEFARAEVEAWQDTATGDGQESVARLVEQMALERPLRLLTPGLVPA